MLTIPASIRRPATRCEWATTANIAIPINAPRQGRPGGTWLAGLLGDGS
jgi:hypothetical protein